MYVHVYVRTLSVSGVSQVVRVLVSPNNPNQATAACQRSMQQCGECGWGFVVYGWSCMMYRQRCAVWEGSCVVCGLSYVTVGGAVQCVGGCGV